jgi:hypothetical protein
MKTDVVNVIETKNPPSKINGYVMIMRGIQSTEAARAWGERHGFRTVYWMRAAEKVYGVQGIHEEALALDEKSKSLLRKLNNVIEEGVK